MAAGGGSSFAGGASGFPKTAEPVAVKQTPPTFPEAKRVTLCTVRGISAAAAAVVPLFTPDFNGHVRAGSALVTSVGAGASAPEVSVGTNSPDYDDIFSLQTLYGIASVFDLWLFIAQSKVKRLSTKLPVFMNVVTPSGGAMSLTLEFEGRIET